MTRWSLVAPARSAGGAMHNMAAGPAVGRLVGSQTKTEVGHRAMTRLMPIWALPRLTALQPTLLMVHQQIKALGWN